MSGLKSIITLVAISSLVTLGYVAYNKATASTRSVEEIRLECDQQSIAGDMVMTFRQNYTPIEELLVMSDDIMITLMIYEAYKFPILNTIDEKTDVIARFAEATRTACLRALLK